MKNKYFFTCVLTMFLNIVCFAQTPIITAIVDGNCAEDSPKILEVYAKGTVDFSLFTIQNQTDSNSTWGNSQSLTELGTITNAFVYITTSNSTSSLETEFPSITNSTPIIISNTANVNGNDRVRIIFNPDQSVIDQYGETDEDGTGKSWEYKDSYAKRIYETTTNGAFVEANWIFGGVGFLDGLGVCQGGSETLETLIGGVGSYSLSNSTINKPYEIEYEINSGIEGQQSNANGLIEIGSQIVTLDNTYGNNFNQTELKIRNKSNGELLHSEILSNSFDDFYNIIESVSVEGLSGFYFVINKSGYDYDTGENIESSLIYVYNSDGLTLLNTLPNTRTSLLASDSGNLFLISSNNINKLNLNDFSVDQVLPLNFANDNVFQFSKIFKLDETNFIFNGNINSGNSNNDVFLSKFDLNAQVFWEKVIDGNRNDFVNDVKLINNEFYLCGQSKSYDGIFASEYGDGVEWGDEPIRSNWVFKLDSNGEIIWNKLFKPTGDQTFSSRFSNIIENESSLILSGSSAAQYDYHSPQFENTGCEDVFAVKIDLNGNTIWEKIYGGFNNQVFSSVGEVGNQIIYTVNLWRFSFLGIGGDFFGSFGDVTAEISGKFDNPLNNSGGSNNNQNDIWVFATDYDGEILWNQFYGGEVSDRVNNTIYNTDFMYMNATTSSINYDVGSLIGTQDSWFVKLKPNNRPEGNDDYATVFEDSELMSINVIDNDTDVDEDDLTIYEISTSGSGTININSDEISIDYTPAANFNGTEVISYTVSDGEYTDSSVLLTITVTSVNDAPEAIVDTQTVTEDVTMTQVDVLSNDTDVDDDTLFLTDITYTGINSVELSTNGLFINYTPTPNFNGTEVIEYTVSDGELTDSGILTLTVTSVNDAPISNDDIIELNEGEMVTLLQNSETTLLENDTDIENDTLSAILMDSPLYGILVLNLDGTFSYQHDGSETTSDYFTYKSNDGFLDSNLATVTIIINPINDNAPSNITLTTNEIEENISDVQIGQLIVTDLDLPSDSHTFELISGAGDDDNDKFYIDGDDLYLSTNLDFETQPNLSIRVKVTDQSNKYFEDDLTINVIDVNDINITSEVLDTYCSVDTGSGSVTIISINDVTGASTFSWSAQNGGEVPVGQENNQNLFDLFAGTYTLNLSNNGFNLIQQFEVGLIPPYDLLTICYVTSDESIITNNRIFLSNVGNYNIDYYEILRESDVADEYVPIGQISSTEVSFLDASSNNNSQSYSYKVRSIDNCGSNSSNSDTHKTILLQSSVSTHNSVNLNWSDYEGVFIPSYEIYRKKNDEEFQIIGSVSSNNNSYNDLTADVIQNSYEYYISIPVDNCIERNSAEIKSNLQNIGPILSLDNIISKNELSIYPNPSKSEINIMLKGSIELIKSEVYNNLGQQVLNTKDLSFSITNLASSTYYIKIFTSKGITIRRFIRE